MYNTSLQLSTLLQKIFSMYSELIETRSKSVDTLAGSDYCVTEKGDVSRPKSAGIKRCKQPEERTQKEERKMELSEAPSPFRLVSKRTPLTDLSGLLQITPEPLPQLNNMQTCKLDICTIFALLVDFDSTAQGQISIIANQVRRMKKDIAKLQQIAEEYKCLEKYKTDIDFLVENVRDAITDE